MRCGQRRGGEGAGREEKRKLESGWVSRHGSAQLQMTLTTTFYMSVLLRFPPILLRGHTSEYNRCFGDPTLYIVAEFGHTPTPPSRKLPNAYRLPLPLYRRYTPVPAPVDTIFLVKKL